MLSRELNLLENLKNNIMKESTKRAYDYMLKRVHIGSTYHGAKVIEIYEGINHSSNSRTRIKFLFEGKDKDMSLSSFIRSYVYLY